MIRLLWLVWQACSWRAPAGVIYTVTIQPAIWRVILSVSGGGRLDCLEITSTTSARGLHERLDWYARRLFAGPPLHRGHVLDVRKMNHDGGAGP